MDVKMAAFNLKALIRETAKSYMKEANKYKVLLLLAIDAQIPELLVGDMVCDITYVLRRMEWK